MIIPTMNKMVKVYVDAASIERIKCGRPTEGTVRNTLQGVATFVRWMNENRLRKGLAYRELEDDFPLVSVVKPPLVHQYLADLLRRGVKPITAVSYVCQLRQLFARWVKPYYEDLGWKVPSFPAFGAPAKTPRYVRPSSEQLLGVKKWYAALSDDPSVMIQARRRLVPASQLWFVATMMLEFAMRNSDIMRLTRQNFVDHSGRVFLNYTPHKTEHSSGRIVKWPVHPTIWEKIRTKFDESWNLPELDAEVFDALNRQMRSLGFKGSKGAYELRKICIDHIYQTYGAEMAVSISGDDIKTITRYYADPSQPNIGDVRVLDLL